MRVVVAMDGGPVAEGALEMVSGWAKVSGVEVLLLTVLDPGDIHQTVDVEGHEQVPVPVGTAFGTAPHYVQQPPPRAVEDRGSALEAARIQAEEYLRAQAARCIQGCVTWFFVEWDRHPARAIGAFAEEQGADLVVVGSHNRGAIKHALLGSVAEGVIRESPVPVLVVRDGMRQR